MPAWFKLFLIGLGVLFWITPISVSIPFVYKNKHLIEIIASYLVLFSIYICYVIFQHVNERNHTKSFFQRLSTPKKIGFVLSSLYFPVLVGSGLTLLTPIISDVVASEFTIHEYKAVKIESYAKSFRNLSKLYVLDVNGVELTFIIKDEMLNQLNLRAGDKFLTRGRSCLAGFVIDNINGVERK